MAKKTIIVLEADALNNDVIHWLMTCIEKWNERMKESPMKCVRFTTTGMHKPELYEDDMIKAFDEWRDKLPYLWWEKV